MQKKRGISINWRSTDNVHGFCRAHVFHLTRPIWQIIRFFYPFTHWALSFLTCIWLILLGLKSNFSRFLLKFPFPSLLNIYRKALDLYHSSSFYYLHHLETLRDFHRSPKNQSFPSSCTSLEVIKTLKSE